MKMRTWPLLGLIGEQFFILDEGENNQISGKGQSEWDQETKLGHVRRNRGGEQERKGKQRQEESCKEAKSEPARSQEGRTNGV